MIVFISPSIYSLSKLSVALLIIGKLKYKKKITMSWIRNNEVYTPTLPNTLKNRFAQEPNITVELRFTNTMIELPFGLVILEIYDQKDEKVTLKT